MIMPAMRPKSRRRSSIIASDRAKEKVPGAARPGGAGIGRTATEMKQVHVTPYVIAKNLTRRPTNLPLRNSDSSRALCIAPARQFSHRIQFTRDQSPSVYRVAGSDAGTQSVDVAR